MSDVESWAGHLLPAGSVFGFLAEHRRQLFPGGMFADLFGSQRGRPSVPADVICSVIVLQALYGLSDREAAEAGTDRRSAWVSGHQPVAARASSSGRISLRITLHCGRSGS